MSVKLSMQTLLKAEIERSSNGSVSVEQGPEAKIYKALTEQFNPAKAQDLMQAENLGGISKIRVLQALSRFSEAQSELNTITEQPEDLLLKSEVLLEKARLSSFEGHWFHVLDICNQSLLLPLPHITRLSFMQVRSNALFELGSFDNALREIHNSQTESSLLPHSVSAFYSQALAVKTIARLKGAEVAHQEWIKLFEKYSTTLTIDHLLTFVRLFVDVSQVAQSPYAKWATASALLAGSVGDMLYQELAQIDLAVSNGEPLNESDFKFARSKSIIQQLVSNNPQTETAKTLHQLYKKQKNFQASKTKNDYSFLFLPTLNLFANLKSLSIQVLNLSEANKNALKYLCEHKNVDIADFFRIHWGPKYNSKKHRPVIKSFARRLNGTFNIKIKLSSNTIQLEDTYAAY